MSHPQFPTSASNTGTPTSAAPPQTVKIAFLTYVLAAAVSLVTLIALFTSDVWDDAIRDNPGAFTSSGMSAEDAINAAKIVSAVVAIVFLALYLLFAFKMRAGRNWARIVLTILSALTLLSRFTASGAVEIGGTEYVDTTSQITGWIGAVLALVAIIAMYAPASNAYFKERKIARARSIAGG